MKCLILLVGATIVAACGAVERTHPDATVQQEASDLQPPFFLAGREANEPIWASLLRLRDAEPKYRKSEEWWDDYCQLRAVAEALLGNHAAALATWDAQQPASSQNTALPAGVHAVDAVDYISGIADSTQVIMINERHHAASDRLLTLELLSHLYDKGFRYLAAETFSATYTQLNDRPYPVMRRTGIYTDEVVFAEVVREALRLGYTLIPYEANAAGYKADSGMSRQQYRDRTQANNLHDRIFRDDPDAKVLVHAGYSHIDEVVTDRWYPMAVYFREISGIDPFTVDQTMMSERGTLDHEHSMYRAIANSDLLTAQSVVLLDEDEQHYAPSGYPADLEVITARTTYSNGRPNWMRLGGRRVAIEIPLPGDMPRQCFVEVRAVNEPIDAVPLDRAELTNCTVARVFVPQNVPIVVRVLGTDGEVLHESSIVFELKKRGSTNLMAD